jgi:hypothetical protein
VARYAVLTVIAFASAMFAMVFYLPIHLQLALGSNTAESGLLLLPLTAGIRRRCRAHRASSSGPDGRR